jgi:hypothetical protein
MKKTLMGALFIVLTVPIVFDQTTLFAELYQWTDANGTKHFSDNPQNAPTGKPSIVRHDEMMSNNPSLPSRNQSSVLKPSENIEPPQNNIQQTTTKEVVLKNTPPTVQGMLNKAIGPIMVFGAGFLMIWISWNDYVWLFFPILSHTSLWRNSREDKERFDFKLRFALFVIGLLIIIWQFGAIIGFWSQEPVKFIY